MFFIDPVEKFVADMKKQLKDLEDELQRTVEGYMRGTHVAPTYVSALMFMVGFYGGNIEKTQENEFFLEMFNLCQRFQSAIEVSIDIVYLNVYIEKNMQLNFLCLLCVFEVN